jgi:predicted membrane protein (TIGR00267 family)
MTQLYLRNVIFGISDSLVSTVGLLAGIDVSGTSRQIVLLTGIVYAFVEAFSMAIGSFLSEESVEDYDMKDGGSALIKMSGNQAFVAGLIMFFSFVIAAFIPIVPYLFFSLSIALWVSIILSIIVLFVVGIVSAEITKVKILDRGFKMALLGGAAILIGVVVGRFVKTS